MSSSAATAAAIQYPAVRRDEDFVENLHGVEVRDPYRWLEDPHSEETKAFVDAQNIISKKFIESYPSREPFKKRMTELFNFEKYSTPFVYGNRIFYFHNTGLQSQDVLYVMDGPDAEPRVLLDLNTFSEDGTVSMNTFSISEDGEWLAYGVSSGGSDWVTVRVRSVAPGQVEDHPDGQIEWVKFSYLSWTHDHKGFFYSRYPALESLGDKSKGTETEKSTQHSVYYHALGTDPSTDRLIVSDPEHPDYNHNAQVSDDGKYCIISVSESTDPVNMLYVLPLEGQSLPAGELPELIKLATNFDSKYEYITNEGPIFYFLTNKDNALNGKVVSIDIRDGTVDKSKDVVPENPTDPLESYTCVDGNKLILGYLHNVSSALRIHDLTSGKLIKELDIPICSVGSLFGRKQMKEFYYRMTSFTLASRIVKYSFENDSEEIFRDAKLTNFNPDLFKVEQKFFTSKDGTQVPMFLVHRKDLKLDGTNPVFLYGYGGFNIPLGPSFSVSRIIFADNFRGVYALANLRGGGEFGEKWHKAGQRENKQNVFDDFHAAAEFLIKEKYTNPEKIAINGGSNGGLLVGAAVTQRPDLYGAAVADVGVLDMLRFHKFTIGHFWMSDYGCPDKEEDFQYLYKYSPYHNIRIAPGQRFPSVMVTTGDHDDRVVPLHSHKFIAALQHALENAGTQGSDIRHGPAIARIETRAGHGAGKPTMMIIDETCDRFAFIAKALDLTYHE